MPLNIANIGEWNQLPFFQQGGQYCAIREALQQRRDDGEVWFPPAERVFWALEMVQPDAVRVVILGQDPYPTAGHANGLAFSVEPNIRPLPDSLCNIFQEMRDDLGATPPNGDLSFWADQGVLLLNSCLTVVEGRRRSHSNLGWDALTNDVLGRLNGQNCAYFIWGADAMNAAHGVAENGNLVLRSSHPSRLSAGRRCRGFPQFMGSRPFSRTNDWLAANDMGEINWTNPRAA